MSTNKVIRQMFTAATLVTMFAAVPAHATSGSATSWHSISGADTMDASGSTQANREGRMSPTGQNETAVSRVWSADSASSSGSSTGTEGTGASGANTMDASGRTQANREGRMSPTGQNETTNFAG